MTFLASLSLGVDDVDRPRVEDEEIADLDGAWPPVIRIEAPPTVFAEVKRDGKAFTVHLLNYAADPVPPGGRIMLRAEAGTGMRCSFAAPMEARAPSSLAAQTDGQTNGVIHIPAFADYGVVELSESNL